MALKRPRTFAEVKGHTNTIQYLRKKIAERTLPQFLLLYSEEGLGKTTLAKIIACELAHVSDAERELVFEKNMDVDSVKTYKMSIEGGKEVVKEATAEMNTSFVKGKVKVIIMDEAHRMKPEAQDVLLTETEFLADGVYVILITTDLSAITKPIQSRATILTLHRLKRQEMHELLEADAQRRRLIMESPEQMFDIICAYSEHKPRNALKILDAMGYATKVSLKDIKQHIDLRDPEEIQELLLSLGNSLYSGIEILFKLQADPDMQKLITDLTSECIRMQHRMALVRFDFEIVRKIIDSVPEEVLVRFLYEVANIKEFNNNSLMAAYMRSHPEFSQLLVKDDSLIEAEKQHKMDFGETGEVADNYEVLKDIPTFGDLIKGGKLFGEG